MERTAVVCIKNPRKYTSVSRGDLTELFYHFRLSDEISEAQDEINAMFRGESSLKQVARELADMMILLLACFRAIVQPPTEYVKEKIQKIRDKYPVELFSNGIGYDEAVRLSNLRWSAMRS